MHSVPHVFQRYVLPGFLDGETSRVSIADHRASMLRSGFLGEVCMADIYLVGIVTL